MPHDIKSMHPSGKIGITFSEEEHLYVDDNGIEYTSVTTLVDKAFAPFDAATAAAMKEKKTGIPAEKYISDWKEYGSACAFAGTRTHENCENHIRGNWSALHTPVDDNEKARFRAAWYEVEELQKNYTIEPEKLVFSPRFRVAGSIDMFCHSAGNAFAIGDWKFVKKLRRKSFGGRTGIAYATVLIPDCNFYHYALQLNIYWTILCLEGYVPRGSSVNLFLKKYDFDKKAFEHVPLPFLQLEALTLLAFNATNDGLEYCPF